MTTDGQPHLNEAHRQNPSDQPGQRSRIALLKVSVRGSKAETQSQDLQKGLAKAQEAKSLPLLSDERPQLRIYRARPAIIQL